MNIEETRAIILADDETAIKALRQTDVEPLYQEIVSALPNEEDELRDVIEAYVKDRHPEVTPEALPDWLDRYERVFEVHQGTFLTTAEREARDEAEHRFGDPEYLGEQAERAAFELENARMQDGREEAAAALAHESGVEQAEIDGGASAASPKRTYGIETRADALETLTDERNRAFGFDRTPEELDNWKTENLLGEARAIAAHREALRSSEDVGDLRSRVYDMPLHQRVDASYVLSSEIQKGIGATVAAAGISPLRFEERMRRGAPSRGQEVIWVADDITDVARHHDLDILKDDDLQKAIEITRETHDRVADQIADLQLRLEGPEQETGAMKELRRAALTTSEDVERVGFPAFETDDAAGEYLRQVRERYDNADLSRMSQGDASVLSDLTPDASEQRNIALGILILARKDPDILSIEANELQRGIRSYRAEMRQAHEIDGHSL